MIKRLFDSFFKQIGIFVFISSLGLVFFKPTWNLYFPTLIPEYIGSFSIPLAPPSLQHWLGTDELGRDLFIRLLFGTGYSCIFAFLVSLGTLFLGLLVGLFLGFLPSKFRGSSSLFQESIGALPFLPLALALLCFFPGNIFLIGALKILLGWPLVSHLVYQETQLIELRPMVQSAVSQGLTRKQLIIRFYLPQFLNILKGLFHICFVSAILNLATLDFFGLGFSLPTPTLPEGFRQFLEHPEAWWLFVFPLVFLLIILGGLRRFPFVDQPH